MDEFDMRDLFAGLAMVGLIHHFDFNKFSDDPMRVAAWAYDAADAMLEARKPQDPEDGIAAINKRKK